MIDYILPNMYILCVIMYFQRISEHTALEQMCTVEAGQNSNEVPSQSLNVFYHSGKKVEGCTVFQKSSCLFGLKKKNLLRMNIYSEISLQASYSPSELFLFSGRQAWLL